MTGIAGVVLDIEGTTTPIRFVHEVLFPFARARLPDLLRDRADDPAVAAELAAIRAIAPGEDPLAVLMAWMDRDEKATPLKALQGVVWNDGYADGSLQGVVYPDVAPAMARWHAAGLVLAIYSSGSVAAQRLVFGHSTSGDLTPLLSAYFDTTTGPKRSSSSYVAIAEALTILPSALLFLSDVGAELDAAAAAGMLTCQLVRADDGTIAISGHPGEPDFDAVAARFGLPLQDSGAS